MVSNTEVQSRSHVVFTQYKVHLHKVIWQMFADGMLESVYYMRKGFFDGSNPILLVMEILVCICSWFATGSILSSLEALVVYICLGMIFQNQANHNYLR